MQQWRQDGARAALRRERLLTIKGHRSTADFALRVEKSITESEALALLFLCEPGLVEKVRWLVPSGNHTIEVDEFLGDNEGLVVAEIELHSPDEPYLKPDFLGKEVTGEARYYNSQLRRNPFKNW